MSRETKVPSISAPRSEAPEELKRVVTNIVEALDVRLGRRGDPIDRAITLRELVDGGLVKLKGGTISLRPNDLDFLPVLPQYPTRPPRPTGVFGSAGFRTATVFWDQPVYPGHSLAEVWRHTVNILGDATLIGTSSSTAFTDGTVASGTTYYYWVRFVNASSIYGDFHATNGLALTVAIDVDLIVGLLAGAISENELTTALGTRITLLDTTTALHGVQIASNTSAITSIQTVNATQATQINVLTTNVGTNTSAISTLNSTTAAQAIQISTLFTTTGANTSAISTLNSTTATQASQITTLQSTVAGNTAAIAIEAIAVDGLQAQYTVKIDVNGHVAGYGLAVNPANESGASSSFIVRADEFAIVSTANPGDIIVPFIVTTTTTTLNGVSVPPGVYIADAYIRNGAIAQAKIGLAAIDTARIADLAVNTAKIADAAISEAKIQNAAITSAKIQDAAITTAKIGDLQVDTIKITGNAVSQTAVATAGGTTSVDIIFPARSGTVLIWGTVYPSGTSTRTFTIKKNGVAIKTLTTSSLTCAVLMAADAPGTGNVTYTVECSISANLLEIQVLEVLK